MHESSLLMMLTLPASAPYSNRSNRSNRTLPVQRPRATSARGTIRNVLLWRALDGFLVVMLGNPNKKM